MLKITLKVPQKTWKTVAQDQFKTTYMAPWKQNIKNGMTRDFCIVLHFDTYVASFLLCVVLSFTSSPVSLSSPVSCYLSVSIPLSLDYKKPWFVAVLLPVLFQFIFFSVKSLLSQTFGLLLLLASLGFVFGDQLLKLAFCRELCLPLSTLCFYCWIYQQ